VVAELRKIPTPWKQQWRRIRYGLLPVVTMAACSVAVGLLWHRQYEAADALGYVEQVKAHATARQAGTLVPLGAGEFSVYDSVAEGEVVARLDDRSVLARMATAEAELARLRAELGRAPGAAGRGGAASAVAASQPAAREREEARLEALRQTLLALGTRVEMGRQETAIAAAERTLLRGDPGQTSGAAAARDAAKARLTALADQRDAHLRAAEAARARAAARGTGTDEGQRVATLHAAISAQEAALGRLELQAEGLEIRAPIGGKIVTILRRPGESVRAGAEVMAIASDHADRIVAYLRPEARATPARGATAYIWPRGNAAKPVAATVEAVGPGIQEVPDIVARSGKTREWGLPVIVRLPGTFAPMPGEVVNVRFPREGTR
jgi:multidrug resistance efflux pump